MDKKQTVALLILLFVLCMGLAFTFLKKENVAPDIIKEEIKTLNYGDVTLRLNEQALFKNILIRPLSVEEDSRCPSDVQCIWAGTVRLKVEVVSGLGTSTSILKLGELLTTEAEVITLKDVTPYPNSKIVITKEDYRFVINVVPKNEVVPPVVEGQCFVGGCSSQLCTDRQDIVSTCEYREEYACYKMAVCKRQQNGQCGWSETPELKSCLANPPGEEI